jgi:hypothetical protein
MLLLPITETAIFAGRPVIALTAIAARPTCDAVTLGAVAKPASSVAGDVVVLAPSPPPLSTGCVVAAPPSPPVVGVGVVTAVGVLTL